MESLKVDGNILEAASLLEVARFPHSLRIFEVTLTGDTYEFDGIFDTSSSQAFRCCHFVSSLLSSSGKDATRGSWPY